MVLQIIDERLLFFLVIFGVIEPQISWEVVSIAGLAGLLELLL